MKPFRERPWGFVLLLLAAPGLGTYFLSSPAEHSGSNIVECRHGVVVSSSRPASDAGLSILQQGGNAVDAAIATAFALVPTYPLSGALGGGGFMLVHPAPGGGAPVAFDYRETAPASAWSTMYSRTESQFTRRAVAVPGTVRGLALAHRRFGTLPWRKLIAPAIDLARQGFLLKSDLADALNHVLAETGDVQEFQHVFRKPGGGRWIAGDRLLQPDLARTLELLAESGPDAFYAGPIAQAIVADMNQGNGLITLEDLKNYRALERTPLRMRYRGSYDVYVSPPPSSGGICLLEDLYMMERFDLRSWGRWSPQTLHVMAEAMRRSSLDRARYLGDPAFVDIPAELSTPEHGQALAGTIDLQRATPSEAMPGSIPLSREEENTTHLSVIDKTGMAVANTYTLERLWGSRIVVPKMGFLLNNDMRAFNLFPGLTDRKGTLGTNPNTIAPGKRPLSSQSPTIVAKDDRVKLVTGTPGSRAIPDTLLCILISVLDFEMPLPLAIQAPRLSHDWLPDQLAFESPEAYAEAMETLSRMGHMVVRWKGPLPQGSAHSIWVLEPNRYLGVGDLRRSGEASGY